MSVSSPAIVVVAYNRPEALSLLLETLRAALVPADVSLVISIEGGAPASVIELANTFVWRRGPKRVILHVDRLGLREHILKCGDLSEEFGAVIVLEDDLILSAHFYDYASRALSAFATTPAVGGVALYNYTLNEFNNLDFEPLNDGSDVYFLQIACSWGQAWTWDQWRLFRAWYESAKDLPLNSGIPLPRQLTAWKSTSWKKYYIKYLVETGRYFVYPRHSLSSNTARPGTHTKRPVSIYQSPLEMRPRRWRFTAPSTSVAVYDAFYELTPAALGRAAALSLATEIDRSADTPRTAAATDEDAGSRFDHDLYNRFRQRAFWDRCRRIAAASPANALAKLLFYALKPVQTEIKILSSRWRASRGTR